MARQKQLVNVNKFTQGLITDANPLTFPENASMEEENFVLNSDGSRQRRLGIDYEDSYLEITTTIEEASSINPAITYFKWKNAGGVSDKAFLVVQVGNEIKFFDLDSTPISANLEYTYKFDDADRQQTFGFASVDGMLVVATGQKEIDIFDVIDGSIEHAQQILKVRDFFGLEDIVTEAEAGVSLSNDLISPVPRGGGSSPSASDIDLLSSEGLPVRPTTLTSNHAYNLRNQSWGLPRVDGNNETLIDPIDSFFSETSKFPSNSDSVNEALYPDATDTDDRYIDRFFPADLEKNPVGSSRAGWGHFVIDAMERGKSRRDNLSNMRAVYPDLTNHTTSIPDDTTPGGPKVLAEFAGRAWYAGFSGELTGGDSQSPRMSSYVLFSKVVNSPSDLGTCYQEGDPTSKDSPDLIDTDGGFIRLDGAFNIVNMFEAGPGLIVIAENGVWRISGDDQGGFRATAYQVSKLSDRGTTSKSSIVVVDDTILFWSEDGIYSVGQNQLGDWGVNSLSYGRIQNWVNNVDLASKRRVKGFYDTYEKKVRWIVYNDLASREEETLELILDVGLKAFYTNKIKFFDEVNNLPRIAGVYIGEPYRVVTEITGVTADGVDVEADGDPVIASVLSRSGSSSLEGGYIVVTQISPVVKYTFASYKNNQFKDWYSEDNAGIDSPAFMVTGWLTGEDYSRNKQMPYLTVILKRTESGYSIEGDDFVSLTPSSCKVQVRWDWSDSDRSNKWSREFQAYRYRRHRFPEDINDDHSNGFQTIVTKNKIRGSGKSLAIKFSTEEGKDLHLYGWAMTINVNNDV